MTLGLQKSWLFFLLLIIYKSGVALTINKNEFSFVNKTMVETITKTPSSITHFFDKNKSALIQSLGQEFANLSTNDYKIIFSSIVAYKLKPYGPCTTLTLKGLLNSKTIHCGCYAALTWHLYSLLKPDTKKNHVYFVGWSKGKVCEHTQLFYTSKQVNLLLDPTIALVAKTTFSEVASGKPINLSKIISGYSRHDIDEFNRIVIEALILGQYKPSDLLDYFQTFKQFSQPPPTYEWATPQSEYYT